MGLESSTFIDGLVPTWPLSTDYRREGDNHLRLIKTALKNTFPNLNAAVTATPEILNAIPAGIDDILAAIINQLDPVGVIKMWSGAVVDIPDNYALCDGTGGTPDLRAKFVTGAGGALDPGDTGGAATAATGSAGGHTPSIQGTTLTTAHLPAHRHYVAINDDGSGALTDSNSILRESAGGFLETYELTGDAAEPTIGRTSSVGSGTAHTHTADAVAAHTHGDVATLPPYYALCFIMKTTGYIAP